MITVKQIEEAAQKSFSDQIDPEKSAYECFFHYTDEKLYAAGFEEGLKSDLARAYWEQQFKKV